MDIVSIAPLFEPSICVGYCASDPSPSSSSRSDGGTGAHSTRGGRHSLAHAAAEMEIAKGVAYLKRQMFARAIEVFRAFEKREQTLLDQAATNLSFLYFLDVMCGRWLKRKTASLILS